MSEPGTNTNIGGSFLEYSIDRMINIISQLVKQLTRTVLLQLVLIGVSFIIVFEPDMLPAAESLGMLPYKLAQYCIPFILLKLHFDWGYKSYHYLLVRANLEKCLGKFHSDSKDKTLSKQDYIQMFIPTSSFTTFFGTNKNENRAEISNKNIPIQYFFVFSLIISLAISNFVALYFLYQYFASFFRTLFLILFGISYGVSYFHYYRTTEGQPHYRFILLLIVIAHILVTFTLFMAMPTLLTKGPFLYIG